MAINKDIAQQLLKGKGIEFNFDSISNDDAQDYTDTVDAVLGKEYGDSLRKAWTNSRVGEKNGRNVSFDLTQIENKTDPFRTPGPDLGVLAQKGAELIGEGFKLFAPVEKVKETLMSPIREKAMQISGAGPAEQQDSLATPGLVALPRGDMNIAVPDVRKANIGMVESPQTRESFAKQAAYQSMVAPFEMTAQTVAEMVGSPLGLATLPLAPASIGAKFGARSALGFAAKGGLKAGEVVGKKGAQLGLKALYKVSPEAGKTVESGFARFWRPPELRDIMLDADYKLAGEREQLARYWSEEGPFGKAPIEEQESMLRASAQAGHERAQALRKMHERAIKAATPENIGGVKSAVRNAQKEVLGRQPLEQGKAIFAMKEKGINVPAPESSIIAGEKAGMQMAEALQERAVWKARAKEIADMTEQEWAASLPQDISDMITKEARQKGLASLPDEQRRLVEEVMDRRRLYEMRRIAAGEPQEAFRRFEGVQIPQYYTDFEVGLEEGRGFFGGRKAVTQEGVTPPAVTPMQRRIVEVPENLKELKQTGSMRYTGLKGDLILAHDTAVAEMFDTISKAPSLASDSALSPAWVKIPDNPKRWMNLSGKWVHPSVWAELQGPVQRTGTADKYIRKILKALTIYNPPVHFGNIVSNTMLGDFAGASQNPLSRIASLRSIKNEDEVYKIISQTGIITKRMQYKGQELDRLVDDALSAAKTAQTGADGALEYLTNVLTKSPKLRLNPEAMYAAEEAIEKYHVAHYAYTHGIPEFGIAKGDALAAARHADKWIINWSDIPVGMKDLRSNIGTRLVLSPFLTFQAKVTPLMAEALVRNPHKFVKYHAMLEGWNRAAFDSLGLTKEDWDKYKENKSKQAGDGVMGAFARIAPELIIPKRTNKGDFYAVGVARFTPWGQFISPRQMPIIQGGIPFAGGLATAPLARALETDVNMGPGWSSNAGSVSTSSPGYKGKLLAQYGMTALSPIIPPPLIRAAGALASPFAKYSMRTKEGLPGPANTIAKALELTGMSGIQSTGESAGPIQRLLAAGVVAPYSVNLRKERVRALQQPYYEAQEALKEGMKWGRKIVGMKDQAWNGNPNQANNQVQRKAVGSVD